MASPSLSESLGGTPEAAEFGAALRDMRLAHNAEISTVASTLRIRQVYLQAIEDGRFGDLPGPTYAAGFVRAYAEYLGLEIPEVMRRYREVTRGGGTQAPLVAPSPVSEGRMPTGFILLMAAVLAGIAYGTWYYMTLNGRDAGDLVAQLPQKIADIVGMDRSSGETPTPSRVEQSPPPVAAPAERSEPAPASSTASTPAEPRAPIVAMPAPTGQAPASEPEPAPQETFAETAAPPAAETEPPASLSMTEMQPPTPAPVSEPMGAGQGAVATEPLPAESVAGDSVVTAPTVAETAPAAGVAEMPEPAPAPAPAPVRQADRLPVEANMATGPEQAASLPPAAPAAPVEEPSGRVVLRATAISWVELRDADGQRIFSRLLKKGETYNVPSKNGITLATGNAGALDILVDGQAISPIGPLGAVRRDVLLEPEALLARATGGR